MQTFREKKKNENNVNNLFHMLFICLSRHRNRKSR